jgi:putative solute:sodium symporter small subunit
MGSRSDHAGSAEEPPIDHSAGAYWRANVRVILRCLLIWFAVSYGCGILLADWLDQFRIGGFGLGFWFAQQGSILVFLGLIGYYVRAMDRIDHEFDVDDDEDLAGDGAD